MALALRQNPRMRTEQSDEILNQLIRMSLELAEILDLPENASEQLIASRDHFIARMTRLGRQFIREMGENPSDARVAEGARYWREVMTDNVQTFRLRNGMQRLNDDIIQPATAALTNYLVPALAMVGAEDQAQAVAGALGTVSEYSPGLVDRIDAISQTVNHMIFRRWLAPIFRPVLNAGVNIIDYINGHPKYVAAGIGTTVGALTAYKTGILETLGNLTRAEIYNLSKGMFNIYKGDEAGYKIAAAEAKKRGELPLIIKERAEAYMKLNKQIKQLEEYIDNAGEEYFEIIQPSISEMIQKRAIDTMQTEKPFTRGGRQPPPPPTPPPTPPPPTPPPAPTGGEENATNGKTNLNFDSPKLDFNEGIIKYMSALYQDFKRSNFQSKETSQELDKMVAVLFYIQKQGFMQKQPSPSILSIQGMKKTCLQPMARREYTYEQTSWNPHIN